MGAKEDGVVTLPECLARISRISEENKSYLRLTLGLFCLFQNLATSAGKVHGIVLGRHMATPVEEYMEEYCKAQDTLRRRKSTWNSTGHTLGPWKSTWKSTRRIL